MVRQKTALQSTSAWSASQSTIFLSKNGGVGAEKFSWNSSRRTNSNTCGATEQPRLKMRSLLWRCPSQFARCARDAKINGMLGDSMVFWFGTENWPLKNCMFKEWDSIQLKFNMFILMRRGTLYEKWVVLTGDVNRWFAAKKWPRTASHLNTINRRI